MDGNGLATLGVGLPAEHLGGRGGDVTWREGPGRAWNPGVGVDSSVLCLLLVLLCSGKCTPPFICDYCVYEKHMKGNRKITFDSWGDNK